MKPSKLEFHAQTPVNRQRCTWAERARIGQVEERHFGRIEEGTECVVALVEQVLNQPERFDVLRELVRRVQIEHPVTRQLGILVGLVAGKILSAESDEI